MEHFYGYFLQKCNFCSLAKMTKMALLKTLHEIQFLFSPKPSYQGL
jgi:hypothetical protein